MAHARSASAFRSSSHWLTCCSRLSVFTSALHGPATTRPHVGRGYLANSAFRSTMVLVCLEPQAAPRPRSEKQGKPSFSRVLAGQCHRVGQSGSNTAPTEWGRVAQYTATKVMKRGAHGCRAGGVRSKHTCSCTAATNSRPSRSTKGRQHRHDRQRQCTGGQQAGT